MSEKQHICKRHRILRVFLRLKKKCHIHNNDEISNNKLRPTPEGTATRSEPDNPEELDNISVETLSDYLGNIDMAACGLSAEDIMDAEDIVEAVVEAYTLLEVEDIHNLSSFDLCVRFKPTKEFFAELIWRYQPIDSAEGTQIPSIKQLRTLTRKISGLSAKRHHCCSAMNPASTQLASLGIFLPPSPSFPNFVPYLLALSPQRRCVIAIQLRDLYVVIDGKPMPYKYFEEEHKIALGIGLDGACPFKRQTNTCWPILIINYNLSSEERTRIKT
ncbi:Transposase family tnp2 [Rhizoctonia solani]|uniref:Transposase family tnp2 n=1 Tax=Rhizoctonia solani TaxID=456999 RepID=A0A8H7I773_9AGAM|nr:Transposase family tnp2 [Rhizoctonia solani]